jgi:putative endonuclease
MQKKFFVYIMTNKRRGTLYTGVTSELPKRVWQHKSKVMKEFAAKYNLSMLVYYEACENAETAIVREKRIKKWNRAWKIEMIENFNPCWRDLYEEIAS